MATAANDALVSKLLTAASQIERINDIANDTQFVFNFLTATRGVGQDGFVVAANSGNFPALLTGNGAMAVGVLGPCGLNSPHIHPRATEIQIVTQGGPLKTGFVMENAARLVQTIVPLGSATLFPKGSMHFQQNLGCEPAVFVASFDFYDPGTQQTAQTFFALDPASPGTINATLGDIGVDFLSHLHLPANVVLGAQECLDRCHIDRTKFNFTATFADYIAFSNSSWTIPSALPSPVASAYTQHPAANLASSPSPSQGSTELPFSQNPLRHAVIGLGATSATLLLACIAMLLMGIIRRRKGAASPAIVTPAFNDSRVYSYASPYDDTSMMRDERRSTEKERSGFVRP